MEPATVSVFTVPDGSGDPLSDCYLFGGEKTDATIELVLRDEDGNPVPDFPAEEIWLASMQDGLVCCPGGSIADGPTDENGYTSFSQSLYGGGATHPELGEFTVIVVAGCASYLPGRTIHFNSPDLNGDLGIDLVDAILFAEFFYGDYSYAADFHWDGVLDLADIVLLRAAFGTFCP